MLEFVLKKQIFILSASRFSPPLIIKNKNAEIGVLFFFFKFFIDNNRCQSMRCT